MLQPTRGPSRPPEHRPRPRRAWSAPSAWSARSVTVVVMALVLGGCFGSSAPEPTPTDVAADPVLVGTGPDAEARLLAEVVVALVRARGLSAEVVELAGADDVRRALEIGDVDVLPSYTGEAWLRVLGRSDPPNDPATSLARVREHDEQDGLRWLNPTIASTRSLTSPPADVTFAFVVDADGPHADLVTLSQLAARLGQLEAPALCVDPSFASRADGLAVVLDAYSVDPDGVEVLPAEPADAVLGVGVGASAGGCDAGLTSATDGAAWAAGQRPLVDDLGVFPAFVVAPVARIDALRSHDGLEAALAPLLKGLTTALLGQWNARVVAGEPPASVALDAVTDLGVVDG